MESIIQILQDATDPQSLGKPEKEALLRLLPYENRIRDELGLDFLSALEKAWSDLHSITVENAYRSGFLTAFQLWAEIAFDQNQAER